MQLTNRLVSTGINAITCMFGRVHALFVTFRSPTLHSFEGSAMVDVNLLIEWYLTFNKSCKSKLVQAGSKL